MDWFLYGADGQSGPYSADQIREWIAQGSVTTEWSAWASHLAAWTRLGDLPEFAAAIEEPVSPQGPPDFSVRAAVADEEEGAFWLVLLRPDQFDQTRLGGILARLTGNPRAQVMVDLVKQSGLLARVDTREEADEYRQALSAEGFEIGVIPEGGIGPFPQARPVIRFELGAGAFIAHLKGVPGVPPETVSLEWHRLALVCAGRADFFEGGGVEDIRSASYKAAQEQEKGTLAGAAMEARAAIAAVRTSPKRVVACHLRLYTVSPAEGLGLVLDSIDWSGLGERRAENLIENMRALAGAIQERSPGILCNRGMRALLDGGGIAEIKYKTPDEFEGEARWLFVLAGLGDRGGRG